MTEARKGDLFVRAFLLVALIVSVLSDAGAHHHLEQVLDREATLIRLVHACQGEAPSGSRSPPSDMGPT